MLLVKAYAAPSKIHGIGLFAAELIPANAIWWSFNPVVDRVIPAKHLPMMPEHFRIHVERYGFLDDGFWTLCGDLAIFVNHSDNPPSIHGDSTSTANRAIEAGEEITENYSDFHCAVTRPHRGGADS